jgi:hypothetical protein
VKHDPTEAAGVSLVQLIVTNDFGWIFRDQRTDDKGIDAQFEVCTNGKAIGRLIGVQIKAGPRYFRGGNEEGWIYRDTLNHLEYYLDHDLFPVIIVLCDLQVGMAYWQTVELKHIESTRKGWKLTVPKRQVLRKSEQELRAITHPSRKRLNELHKVAEAINADFARLSELQSWTWLVHFYRAIRMAKQSIYFASPFISDEMMMALKAVSVDVQVRGIITGHPSQKMEPYATTGFDPALGRILNIAIQIRRNLHTKFLIIDGAFVFYGSANFTTAGLTRNAETMQASIKSQEVHSFVEAFWKLWHDPALIGIYGNHDLWEGM